MGGSEKGLILYKGRQWKRIIQRDTSPNGTKFQSRDRVRCGIYPAHGSSERSGFSFSFSGIVQPGTHRRTSPNCKNNDNICWYCTQEALSQYMMAPDRQKYLSMYFRDASTPN